VSTSIQPNVDPPRIVLKPKLRAPLPRLDQIVRRELLEFLSDGLNTRVSVVSAPTGYGKTTLLAHWRRAEEEGGLPFAWVSLDEQDDDPIRLWRHIVEALRTALTGGEEFRDDALVSMGAAGQGFVEITLPSLINEIARWPVESCWCSTITST